MSNPIEQFPTDAAGNIILHAVRSYSTISLAKTAIGLSLEIEGKDGLKNVIVLALHPQQAIAMARSLTAAADHILGQPTPPRSGQS